jgi:thioredoxin 2
MSTSDTLVIACPDCATLNRVPRARLSDGGTCGRCGKALFNGHPVELSAANFDRHAVAGDLPLLIDFWAAWCGPCRQMASVFASAASKAEPRLRFGKLDTEAEPALAARFRISSIPSLVLVHKGRELARTAGAMPEAALLRWIETSLAGLV